MKDAEMRKAADAWLASLTPEQRQEALVPHDSPKRAAWMYVPGPRPGISWGQMTDKQKELAKTLLKTAVSESGYKTIETIRSLELQLREMEGNNMERDPNRYWIIFFGEPSDEHSWAWRYEGHHVSLTFAVGAGRVVASTPQFLGANPAEVKAGPLKGTRPLAKQQDLAFQFMESLSEKQHTMAIVSDKAPADIVTGTARKVAIQDDKGVPYKELSPSQGKLLMDLIRAHAAVQTDGERERRMKALEKAGLDNIVFGWMGPVQRSGRHYYRIQGKTFLIEFDDTQDDGNHIHTVWRDFDGDFGPDELAEHYEHDHDHTHR